MRTRARRFAQFAAIAVLAPIAVVMSGSVSSGVSMDFAGTGTGAVPDGGPGCDVVGSPLDVSFSVSGVTSFDDIEVSITFNPDHTWMGDLRAVLIGPDATEVSLFGDVGVNSASASECGDSSDMGGTYTFSDGAAGDLWTTAANTAGGVVAPGAYFPTAQGGPGVVGNAPQVPLTSPFNATDPNGTWTLRVTDSGGGDTTSVTAASLSFSSAVTQSPSHNFDGDLLSDYSVVRNETAAPAAPPNLRSIEERDASPGFEAKTAAGSQPPGSNLAWYISNSSDGTFSVELFGEPNTDFWVPSDFDGDGEDDVAVWRGIAPNGPGGGEFHWINSSDGTPESLDFGQMGDNPTVTGDYDGDGVDDPAVHRCPPNPGGQCSFYYQSSVSDSLVQFAWGNNSSGGPVRPYPGDVDGDGKFDFTIFQDGFYVIYRSSDGGVEWINWGLATDAVLAPGDYDGDGTTDLANIRVNGSDVEWWILERDGGIRTNVWGAVGIAGFSEFAAQGDADGDGATDLGIWRRDNGSDSNSFFYMLRSSDSMLETFEWGSAGDAPVPGWNGN